MNNERYVPGSEWVTYKLYTTTQSADSLLLDKIYPVVKKLLADGCISQFFFIRYSDPDFHLRVRVKVAAPDRLGPTLEAFVPTLVKCFKGKLIHNIVIDSYVPETQRYGADTMELTEKLFCIDSRGVADILRLLRIQSGSDRHRWLVSLMMLRDTLDCFFANDRQRADATAQIAQSFKREHGFTTKQFTKQLNNKYRNYNELITRTLGEDNPEMGFYRKALARRKKEMELLMADNAALIGANEKQWKENFSSVSHMTMNRLFKSNNRLFEMVIYEFMSKYQSSQLARAKYKTRQGKEASLNA